jgi:hypothetical protein
MGKTEIEGVDDKEEMEITDVRLHFKKCTFYENYKKKIYEINFSHE